MSTLAKLRDQLTEAENEMHNAWDARQRASEHFERLNKIWERAVDRHQALEERIEKVEGPCTNWNCTCDRGGMSTPAPECPIHGEEVEP